MEMDYKAATRPHNRKCDSCGRVFECMCDIMRGDDGDGRPAPYRRCIEERAVCEDCDCDWDAYDYACEKADADNKGEKE